MSGQLSTFYSTMQTLLAGVAPFERGPEDEGKQTSPPRYAWVRLPPKKETTRRQGGANPGALRAKMERFAVAMWASDDDGLENMEAALLTALQEARPGKFDFEYGDCLDLRPGSQEGIKQIIIVSVFFEIPQAFLPAISPAALPGSSPTTTVESATFPTVTVTKVEDDTNFDDVP